MKWFQQIKVMQVRDRITLQDDPRNTGESADIEFLDSSAVLKWANSAIDFTGVTRFNNNVKIGSGTPSEALDVTGNIKASGTLTAAATTLTGLTVNGDLSVTGTLTGPTSLTISGDIAASGASSDVTAGGALRSDGSYASYTRDRASGPFGDSSDAGTGKGGICSSAAFFLQKRGFELFEREKDCLPSRSE